MASGTRDGAGLSRPGLFRSAAAGTRWTWRRQLEAIEQLLISRIVFEALQLRLRPEPFDPSTIDRIDRDVRGARTSSRPG